MYATISVPQETKELIRRILRADQLTIAINLQVKNKYFFFQKSSIFAEKFARYLHGKRFTRVNRPDLYRERILDETSKNSNDILNCNTSNVKVSVISPKKKATIISKYSLCKKLKSIEDFFRSVSWGLVPLANEESSVSISTQEDTCPTFI